MKGISWASAFMQYLVQGRMYMPTPNLTGHKSKKSIRSGRIGSTKRVKTSRNRPLKRHRNRGKR